jgi:hypothetical protein
MGWKSKRREREGEAMNIEEMVAKDTFQVGRFKCTMTLGDGTVSTEWEPNLPKGLTKNELRQYRKGRDRLVARAFPGKKVVMVEY